MCTLSTRDLVCCYVQMSVAFDIPILLTFHQCLKSHPQHAYMHECGLIYQQFLRTVYIFQVTSSTYAGFLSLCARNSTA